jgi:hypothetical protein
MRAGEPGAAVPLPRQAFSFRAPELCAAAALFFAALLLALARGLSFRGYHVALPVLALLLLVWAAYGASGRSARLSNMAYLAALWIAFSMAAGVCTYLAAHTGRPLADAALDRLDARLGFSWTAWNSFTQSLPWLDRCLYLAYFSLPLQIILAIFYFSDPARMGRNRELFANAMLSIVLTSVFAALYPALGTFASLGIETSRAVHLAHLLQLRAGGAMHFDFTSMQGIVAFPSYHTVLAILFTWTYRGSGWPFRAALALNLAMLLATPTYGGHYLSDMIAGALVAALSIGVVKRFLPRAR